MSLEHVEALELLLSREQRVQSMVFDPSVRSQTVGMLRERHKAVTSKMIQWIQSQLELRVPNAFQLLPAVAASFTARGYHMRIAIYADGPKLCSKRPTQRLCQTSRQ